MRTPALRTETLMELRPVWADVDLGAVRTNVGALRELVAPAALLAVVKADGYGHGAEPVARAALDAGAAMLGVALVEEGVALREAGIDAPILLLSEPVESAAADVVANALTPAVYTTEGIDALAAAARHSPVGGPVAVHLKVDTGMHRVGCRVDDAVPLVRRIAGYDELTLEAVWTHLAVADEPDRPETPAQLATFRAVVDECRAAGATPRVVHAANTAGAIAWPDARLDLVRCGIGVYGIDPAPAVAGRVPLTPALSVTARVTYVKRLRAGERLSYGLRYPMPEEGFVATVPIGYADGVPRNLAAVGGEVLVRGRRCPIAGTVTMDQLMVDLGDLCVDVGEEVVLLGAQGREYIGAQEWADKLGTIAYEIVCGIGPRVPRRYLP
jgi:alanine racemase